MKIRLRCSFACRGIVIADRRVRRSCRTTKSYTQNPTCRFLPMTFQVGEKIVYPNHGVATIENISSRAFAGHYERFYLLRLVFSSLTVMVPFSHVGDLGLR